MNKLYFVTFLFSHILYIYIYIYNTEYVTKIRQNSNLNFPLYMLPPVVVGIRESLMLLINNHILKMAAMLKPSTEY